MRRASPKDLAAAMAAQAPCDWSRERVACLGKGQPRANLPEVRTKPAGEYLKADKAGQADPPVTKPAPNAWKGRSGRGRR